MKLIKTRRPDERVRGLKTSGRSEQRFRYPATEEISEISCRADAQRWTEGDQPANADGPDAGLAS